MKIRVAIVAAGCVVLSACAQYDAQQQAEAQHRELTLLRQQMANNHRTMVLAMLMSAVVISAALLFQ